MGLTILSLLLLCGSSFADLSSEYKNKASLTDAYKLYWTHNSTSNVMQIALEVKATGWVALAFTKEKSNNMENYDACLGYVSGSKKSLKGYLTNGHRVPPLDPSNDCMLEEAMEVGGTTTIKYHRRLGNEGDSKDVVIEKGEIIVVWAYKNTDDSLTKHDKRGFATVTMISASEAIKLKFGLAFLAIAVAFLF
ncbi:uncharacterized protein LOC144662270 [Oculina patagonica]